MSTSKLGWVVFMIFITATICFIIGGINRPEEINIYSWSSWLLLSILFLWSCKAQGFANWRMPLAFVIANIAILILAFYQGGYTTNLTTAEVTVFFCVLTTLSVWIYVGKTKNIWSPRIIFWGSIISDLATYYPQTKQYWGPNPIPGRWTMIGWAFALTAYTIQIFLVDKVIDHLKSTSGLRFKERFVAFEPQLFGIEQIVTVTGLVCVMMW